MQKTRRNRMNSTKIGVIFIISALALAGIGAGYAAWTDTIYIDGTISAGSVQWEVIDYSGTYVWKIHGLEKPYNPDWGEEIYVDYDHITEADSEAYVQSLFPNYIIELISYSLAAPGEGDFDVDVEFVNLFPCIWFKADIVIKYMGTVPGRVNDILYSYTPEMDWIEPLIASGDIYATARSNGEVVDLGYQLHENDLIEIELWIHIPQDNDLMLKSGAFTATFIVAQWNEYPYDGGGCGEDPPIGHNADVMLTIDTSGSIGSDGVIVQNAAKAFVTALLAPNNGQVGIVNFDYGAWLKSTFSMNEVSLHLIIDALVFNGPATNLAAGISLSQTELATADRTPDAHADPTQAFPDYMVIITDGEPNQGGDGTIEATAAKNAGTRIFVLGIGTTGSALLTSIASPGDYYDVADFAALEAILLSLVQS